MYQGKFRPARKKSVRLLLAEFLKYNPTKSVIAKKEIMIVQSRAVKFIELLFEIKTKVRVTV